MNENIFFCLCTKTDYGNASFFFDSKSVKQILDLGVMSGPHVQYFLYNSSLLDGIVGWRIFGYDGQRFRIYYNCRDFLMCLGFL